MVRSTARGAAVLQAGQRAIEQEEQAGPDDAGHVDGHPTGGAREWADGVGQGDEGIAGVDGASAG